MKRILNRANGISLAATFLVTLLAASGSSAAAEHAIPYPFPGDAETTIVAAKSLDANVSPPSTADDGSQAESAPSAPIASAPPSAASSLEQLVADRVDASDLSDELKCLAGAIYFEARSESLEGQLAVGRVIVARTRSGRFPASYCGVVYQHSQFSFIRGQSMPSINEQSPLWQRSVAMARIADAGSWQSPAEGALFFHASRVSAGWRMKRMTQIDHHVFYR